MIHLSIEAFEADGVLVGDLVLHLVAIQHHVIAAHAHMLRGFLVELLQEKQLVALGVGDLEETDAGYQGKLKQEGLCLLLQLETSFAKLK